MKHLQVSFCSMLESNQDQTMNPTYAATSIIKPAGTGKSFIREPRQLSSSIRQVSQQNLTSLWSCGTRKSRLIQTNNQHHHQPTQRYMGHGQKPPDMKIQFSLFLPISGLAFSLSLYLRYAREVELAVSTLWTMVEKHPGCSEPRMLPA